MRAARPRLEYHSAYLARAHSLTEWQSYEI